MKQKEKEKSIKKRKTAKRIVLSAVFLFLILIIFSFNTSFGIGSLLRGEGLFMASHALGLGESIGEAVLGAFNVLLYGVFKFVVGAILYVGANLFDWAINVTNFKMVMDMSSIQVGWRAVRDFLNLFFILVLLFSAFCTIFQVEKWNIKKILLNLVIMALLVNFSFPISRFIIDAGNIPMYHFFQTISGGTGEISKIIFNSANTSGDGKPTGIMKLMYPDYGTDKPITGSSEQTFQLIAAIIFGFIFTLTLLVLAVLFIIRMLVLAILIIFSPVGFVASIFPGFSEYSSKWWNMLFKQSFFGTIMAFMLWLSLMVMNESSKNITPSFIAKAQSGEGNTFSTVIVGGVTLAIPIALLWIGMISAQSMGAVGASAVVGQATKVAKWAGKKFSGAKFVGDTFKAYKARRDKAKEDSWSGKLGRFGASQQDRLRGTLPGGKDASLRYQNDLAAKVKKEAERNDMENMNDTDLRNLANHGNQFEKEAAKQQLAKNSKATAADLDETRRVFGETSQVFRQLQSKVKKYNPAAAFSHIDNTQGARDNAIYDYVKSKEFNAGDLNAEALSNTSLMETMFNAQVINNDDMEKLRKKSVLHKNNLKSTLEIIAHDPGNNNTDNESHKNIQMAYLSQTGKISDTVKNDPNWQKKIFGEATKDNLKRISATDTIDRNGNPEHNTMSDYAPIIAPHLSGGQLKDIVRAMEDNNARADIVRYLGNNPSARPLNRNEATLENVVNGDPYMRSLL